MNAEACQAKGWEYVAKEEEESLLWLVIAQLLDWQSCTTPLAQQKARVGKLQCIRQAANLSGFF